MRLSSCEKEKKRQDFTVYMYVQPNKHAIHQISRQADTKAQNNDHLNYTYELQAFL